MYNVQLFVNYEINFIHNSSSSVLPNLKTRVLYVYMYMYVCMYVCMYVKMYATMYVCMYVCTYECMYVCMYVYMYRIAGIFRGEFIFA